MSGPIKKIAVVLNQEQMKEIGEIVKKSIQSVEDGHPGAIMAQIHYDPTDPQFGSMLVGFLPEDIAIKVGEATGANDKAEESE